MRGGFLTYKCRRCEVWIENIHVPDLQEALVELVGTGRHGHDMVAYLVDVHQCADKPSPMLGITDLIGGRFDAKEGK